MSKARLLCKVSIRGSVGLVLWLLMLWAPLVTAQGTPEYDVKGAFLLNFMRFVEWPASSFANAEAPLEICILGRDPFGRMLDEIVHGEIVQDRAIVVRRITGVPEPHTCQAIFLSASTGAVSIRALRSGGVLIISDDSKVLSKGAHIAFVVESRRVRFDVNQKAAETAGLKVSSKLLSVARTVIK